MLDEAKWVNIGKTYRNTESAKVFTQAIAHVARAEVAAEVEAAKFVSILSDGSTDSAIKEQEMFYIRYVINGQPKVKFLSAVHVERGEAPSILAAIKSRL